jgi:hypothetical protein
MASNNQELNNLVQKFADSGWDQIDGISKKWLSYTDCSDTTAELIAALEVADKECGSCGCEMDPLYKQALALLRAA